MTRAMNRLPEQMLRDEAEMRAFYQSCGISKSTTEAAIKVRLNRPIERDEGTPSRVKAVSLPTISSDSLSEPTAKTAEMAPRVRRVGRF